MPGLGVVRLLAFFLSSAIACKAAQTAPVRVTILDIRALPGQANTTAQAARLTEYLAAAIARDSGFTVIRKTLAETTAGPEGRPLPPYIQGGAAVVRNRLLMDVRLVTGDSGFVHYESLPASDTSRVEALRAAADTIAAQILDRLRTSAS